MLVVMQEDATEAQTESVISRLVEMGFDRLEGRVFRSGRDAERAARALLGVNHHRPAQEAVHGAFAV